MLRDMIQMKIVSAEPDEKITQACKLMSDEDVGAILILSEGKPRGILTDRDVAVRCIAENLDVNDTTIENVMTETVEICRDTDGLFDVIQKMHQAGVRRICVVDDQGNAKGIVSFGDILGVIGKELYMLTQTTTPAEGDQRLQKAA